MSQPPPDTSSTRRLRPNTILWLGVLLGFMGVVAMAVATAMLAFAARKVNRVGQASHFNAPPSGAPRLITDVGRHDSPDERFKLAIMIDANGIVRYSITSTDDAAARLADGAFDPRPGPNQPAGEWFFCWDEESNLWVHADAGHATIHRLRQTVSFDVLTNWTQDPALRQAAPRPVANLLSDEPNSTSTTPRRR